MGHRTDKSYCLKLCKEAYDNCTGSDFMPDHCNELHDGCMTACMSQTKEEGPRYPAFEDELK